MNWYLEVLKQYAVFNGRATRSEYWYFTLFNIIASIICAIMDEVIGSDIGFIGLIYTLAVLLPYIGVTIRRLHDIGKSGWWQLIVLIPLIGAIIMIIWFIKDSSAEENQYGSNPKINNIPSNSSIADLEKLMELKDKGILTDAEFQSKKRELLG